MINLLTINVGCTLQNRRLCCEYKVSAAISSTLKLYSVGSVISKLVFSKRDLDIMPLAASLNCFWILASWILLFCSMFLFITISFNVRASMLFPVCLRLLDSDRVSKFMMSG